MNVASHQALKKKIDVIFTIAIIVFFAVLLVMSFSLSTIAGNVPKVISIFGIILSVLSLIAGAKEKKGSPHDQDDSEETAHAGLAFLPCCGLVIAYLVGMIVLGFILSSFLTMFLMPAVLGYKNYKVNFMFSIITTAVLYTSFVYYFYVDLPIGLLFGLF